jgi:hypothetical protein
VVVVVVVAVVMVVMVVVLVVKVLALCFKTLATFGDSYVPMRCGDCTSLG